MYEILHKQVLSATVKLMVVRAPLVARKAKAGQFVIVRNDERGERIPLTIADFDAEQGTITIIFQEVGKSTAQMGQFQVGDCFANVVGPLGHPTEIENYGKVVMVGGGVGIAPLFPITRALKQAGNHVISIIGARNRSLLFWEDRMRTYSDELIVCTDDGSYGRKALVTEPLKEILQTQAGIARVWAIGPAIMMKFVAAATEPFGVPTIVSLNTIMIDGTGMCGGCRVTFGDGGSQFVCVDGPEFDAHKVDWNLLLERMSFYREQEQRAYEQWKQHQCRLEQAAQTIERQAAHG
ncbi:MAG: sulfide/dihydroorotate dehydrogenase-like FAD/NAD-binding protein [Anaerolineae bacterium]|nr:MAG: sulfide/dihydroorotate dehydrogenase-like FAD/NAD-binding protein [Anaerolineae bacterium]